MLILQRKVGESIVIGDDIVITVAETGTLGSRKLWRVKLAIDAPKSVRVRRKELIGGDQDRRDNKRIP